jgi:hypothetical protein
VDYRSDLFSLGCVLYHMCTGAAPFQGRDTLSTLAALAVDRPRSPREVNPEVTPALSELVMHLLARIPTERPSSAAAVAQALETIGGGVYAPLRQSDASRPAGWARFRRRATLVFAGLLIVLAGMVVYHYAPSRRTAAPRVLALNVRHFARVKKDFRDPRGVLGEQSFAPHLGDSVEVEAQLSRPAYAYMISFRPDGGDERCLPGSDDALPSLTDRPCYPPPEKQAFDYGLDEGEGFQVFALVVSGRPLPAYREWRHRCGPSPWGKATGRPGVVWRFDGAGWYALTADDTGGVRAADREVAEKVPLVQLTRWLSQAPDVEAVAAVAFVVLRHDTER